MTVSSYFKTLTLSIELNIEKMLLKLIVGSSLKCYETLTFSGRLKLNVRVDYSLATQKAN